LLSLPLRYIDKHFEASEDIPDGIYTIGAYHYNITHFMVLSQDKTIAFDPIAGGSITAKYGQLESMRFYATL